MFSIRKSCSRRMLTTFIRTFPSSVHNFLLCALSFVHFATVWQCCQTHKYFLEKVMVFQTNPLRWWVTYRMLIKWENGNVLHIGQISPAAPGVFMFVWGPTLVEHLHSCHHLTCFTSRSSMGSRNSRVGSPAVLMPLPPFNIVEIVQQQELLPMTFWEVIVIKTKYNPWCGVPDPFHFNG